ncbi:MAG: right-handed parallel beta-helix repeat-containing protein [Planctomycetota bacterium]
MFRLPLLLLCLLPARPAAAVEYLVNNIIGEDVRPKSSLGGGNQQRPFRTIQAAIDRARPGDRVFVEKTAEPYREELSLFRCGGAATLTIASDGAVLDGTVVGAPGAWRHVEGDVFAIRPRRLTYQQLFLDGAPLKRVPLTSIASAEAVLEPNQWALVGGRLLLRVEKGRLPHDLTLRHAGLQTGITLYNVRNVVIEGLVIQGFQQDAVNAHDLVSDCVLRNVELRANGRSGLSVGGSSNVAAEACYAYDNGRVQVRAEGYAKLRLAGCEVIASKVAGKQSAASTALIEESPAER